MGLFQSKTKDKNTNQRRSRHQKSSSSSNENIAPSRKLVVLETSFLNKCPRMEDKGRKYTADLQEECDVEDNVEELTHYRDHDNDDLRRSEQSNPSNAVNHNASPLLSNHLTERPGTSYTSSNGPYLGPRRPSSGPYEIRKEKRRTDPPSPDVIPPSPKYFKRDPPLPKSQQQHPKNNYYRPLCMSYSETEESDTDNFSDVAALDLTATALKNESGRYQLCYSVPSTSKSTEPNTISSAESLDSCSDDPWSVHSSQSSLLSSSSSKRQLSINDLPQTIFLKILSYLGMEERCKHVCRVCKLWHQMCFDSELWRKIDLRGKDRVTDDVLGRVTSYSTNVMYVDVSDCNNITDQGVITMAQQCPSLMEFKCTRCNHLTDAAFIALAEGCPGLQKLTVDGVRQITDVAFKQIAACCKELWYLNVSQVNNLTDIGVRQVVTGCPKLTYLKFQENNKVADSSVEAIAEHCPHMEVLGLMGCCVAPNAVLHLTKCTNLKVLNLCRLRELTDQAVIEVVRHCRKLESINLCLNSGITDRSIEFIAREAKCLKDLHMVACTITDTALTSIGKYSRSLETVDVGHCPSITDAGSAFIAQNCRSLRYLGLMRCDAVREETVDELVEKYPQIHFSTLMLDCKRILAQAQQQGWKPAHAR